MAIVSASIVTVVALIGADLVVALPNSAYWIVPLAVAIIIGLRGLRIAILLDDQRGIVRNVWRTYEVAWKDIREVGEADFWPLLLALMMTFAIAEIRTNYGKPIVVQASPGFTADRSVIDELVGRAARYGQ